MVSRLAYHRALSADDRAALLALPHSVKRFERSHYLVREYEHVTHCCVLLSGYAVRTKIVSGGARQM